jgi:hypothetical protein
VGNCYFIRVNILFIQDDDAHLMFASSKFKLHDKLPNSLGFLAQFETSRSEECMKLRRNQYCPIHRSLSCCGREPVPKGRRVRRLGVQRIEDSHHPRGYRELRSKAEMRKLLDRKIVEQNGQCAICQVAFTHYGDIVPDHMDPRGMEGSRRDDHPENIQAVHFWCNGEKGSTREY